MKLMKIFLKFGGNVNSGKPFPGFKLQDGFLFKYNRLCIPKTSLRLQLISETHARGLAGHFGRDKAVAQLENNFYWSGLRKETKKIIQRCPICQETKETKQNTGLYMPLPIATEPWVSGSFHGFCAQTS